MKLTKGQNAILPWVIGGVLSLLDGFVWSEFGAYHPFSGGSYQYLKISFEGRMGKLLSFLYSWQILFIAPLVVASIAIGFVNYFAYIYPISSPFVGKIIAILVIGLVYYLTNRKIISIGKISKFLFWGLLMSLFSLIGMGVINFSSAEFNKQVPIHIDITNWSWYLLLGQATVQSIYCYFGYYNSCHIAEEIENPASVIPKSIFWSVIIVFLIYLLLQIITLGNLSKMPTKGSSFLFSLLVEKWVDKSIGRFFTIIILWLSVACLFSIVTGLYDWQNDVKPHPGNAQNKKFLPHH